MKCIHNAHTIQSFHSSLGVTISVRVLGVRMHSFAHFCYASNIHELMHENFHIAIICLYYDARVSVSRIWAC